MVKLLKLVTYLINTPIFLISNMVPKKKNIWIFGEWFGYKYADNSKYLFEYIIREKKEIRAIWLTKDKKILKYLNKRGLECYHTFSIKGYILSIRASLFFISNSKNDINHFTLNKQSKLINLWHGTPMKKILNDDNKRPIKKNKILTTLFPFNYKQPNYVIASSERTKKIFSTAFKIDLNKIIVSGYPRCDNIKIVNNTSKITKGLYLPTLRDSENQEFKQNLISTFKFLDSKLKKANVCLYVKLHFVDKKINLNNYTNIKNLELNEPEEGLYDVMNSFDFLVSDYSSVIYDFELYEKPILRYAFDLNTYEKHNREFYDNYHDCHESPIVKTKEELYNSIIDQKKQMFPKVLYSRKHNKYFDGKNSERIYKLMKSITDE